MWKYLNNAEEMDSEEMIRDIINIEMENRFTAKNKHIFKLNIGEMDGESENVQENIPNMVLKRNEMELEVWSKDDDQTKSFVGVTRPVLWQDFI